MKTLRVIVSVLEIMLNVLGICLAIKALVGLTHSEEEEA